MKKILHVVWSLSSSLAHLCTGLPDQKVPIQMFDHLDEDNDNWHTSPLYAQLPGDSSTPGCTKSRATWLRKHLALKTAMQLASTDRMPCDIPLLSKWQCMSQGEVSHDVIDGFQMSTPNARLGEEVTKEIVPLMASRGVQVWLHRLRYEADLYKCSGRQTGKRQLQKANNIQKQIKKKEPNNGIRNCQLRARTN